MCPCVRINSSGPLDLCAKAPLSWRWLVKFVSNIRASAHVPLEYLSKIRSWYVSLSPGKQTLVQNIVIWGIAAVCIWWVSSGISFEKFFDALKQAKIWLFVLANVVSFFIWWLGDTILFSTLFSIFHKKTRFREVLPATAAQYFLQAINILAADGALIVFLNRRKGVKWLTATWTMMFQGLIDALVLASTAVVAGLVVPDSALHKVLPYTSAALAFLVAVALWWASGGRPKIRISQWMYNRPSAKAFREAGLRAYLELGSIRLAMTVAQAFLYYYSIKAFVPNVPVLPVLALTPAIQAASNEPVTPQGLGPLQAIVVAGLSKYAHHDKILVAALGISVLGLLCRLPLGLGAAGTFARRVLAIEASEKKEKTDEKIKSSHEDRQVPASPD
jgi:uncharacterized membrane protein YbhN (UPF0104 family)